MLGAKMTPARAHHHRHQKAQINRVRRRAGGAVQVLLPYPAGNGRRSADAESDPDRVDEREDRFGQPDHRDRFRAEFGNEKGVDDGEKRLHRHLKDHRDREDDERGQYRTFGEIAVRPDERFL